MAYAEIALLQDGDVLELITLDNKEQVENYAKNIGVEIERQHVKAAVGIMALWHDHDEDGRDCECMKPENTVMVQGWNLENMQPPQVVIVEVTGKDILDMIQRLIDGIDG